MCEIDSNANNDAHLIYILKGTMPPVTYARDGARFLERVRQTILISSGEPFSVFIDLYLSHPCD